MGHRKKIQLRNISPKNPPSAVIINNCLRQDIATGTDATLSSFKPKLRYI